MIGWNSSTPNELITTTGTVGELFGDAANDTLYFASASPVSVCEEHAGSGTATLIGIALDVYLYAGSGNDVLIGGGQQNYMHGGRGHDTFVLGSGFTVIDNFHHHRDHIEVPRDANFFDLGHVGYIQEGEKTIAEVDVHLRHHDLIFV